MIIYDATHGGVDLSLRYSRIFVMFERVGGMRLMRMDGVGDGWQRERFVMLCMFVNWKIGSLED